MRHYTGEVNKLEYGLHTVASDKGVYPLSFLNSLMKCDWSE